MSEPIDFRERALEERIRRLLLEGNRPEALGLCEDGLEPVPPEVEARLAPLLRDPFRVAKRRARPVWQKILRTAACAVLALSVALGAAMAVSPQVREWVLNVVINWTQGGTEFRGTGVLPEGTEIGVWRLEGVPEGFVEIRRSEDPGRYTIRYDNEQSDRLTFTYQLMQEGYMFDTDNEHSIYSEHIINGQVAYLFSSNTEGRMSVLIWFSEDETIGFRLMGDFSGSELLEMAQTVVPSD